HDDPVALPPAHLQPRLDQRQADPLPLEIGQDCHRGKGQRQHRPGPRDARQVAEEDVADDMKTGTRANRPGMPPRLRTRITSTLSPFVMAGALYLGAVSSAECDSAVACSGLEP